MGRAIEPLERDAAEQRRIESGKKYGIGSENFSEPINGKGEALVKVADAVGMSRPTYTKARAIVQAAESDPKTYGDLVGKMDATGKVDRIYKEVQRRAWLRSPPLSIF